jgi:DNA-binding beta-propeller fold protein YncE
MSRNGSWQRNPTLLIGMIGVVTVLAFAKGSAERSTHTGGPRLVSIEPFADDRDMCEWAPAGGSMQVAAALQQGTAAAAPADPGEAAKLAASQRKAVRVIRDPYEAFSAIAVDPIRNEIVVTDNNFFQILVYDRLANTPPTATKTEPKRILGGLSSKIEFQAGIYVDPTNGDIYAANNDTVDTMVVFSREQRGDVPPHRELFTGQTYGLAVDDTAQEVFVSVQNDSAVMVWKKGASKTERPLRLLQGDKTGLQAPHGIAVDPKNRLMFVANHGAYRRPHPQGKPTMGVDDEDAGQRTWTVSRHVPGSGTNGAPSITVHAIDANGDTPPLRTIQGTNTQLNWPTGVAYYPKGNEIYVANDAGDSILVFSANASGNAAPVRVLKGPKTGIKHPTGLALDLQNDELWVANYGNHSATVYKADANGDVPPLRTIRSSPPNTLALMIGNPGALAYDAKREEILAPN